MSIVHIPPALDRHLVSTARLAATAGDFAAGALDAVVEQIVLALRDQGASLLDIERTFHDVFDGLAFAYQHTPTAARYAALERRAVSLAARVPLRAPSTAPGTAPA